MSAFYLSDEAWTRIARGLGRPTERLLGKPLAQQYAQPMETIEQTIERLLRRCQRANRRAVNGRYGPDSASEMWQNPAPLSIPAPSMIPMNRRERVELSKALECLRYQCSEDVEAQYAEEHAATMSIINRIIQRVTESIVAELPEYESAPWG